MLDESEVLAWLASLVVTLTKLLENPGRLLTWVIRTAVRAMAANDDQVREWIVKSEHACHIAYAEIDSSTFYSLWVCERIHRCKTQA